MNKICSLFIFLLVSSYSFAQTSPKESKPDSLFDKSTKTLVAVPIISNSPAMKTGFGAMGMLFFRPMKKDTLSPPSLVRVAGLYSTNKSYYFFPMTKLFWGDNRHRATLVIGTIRINNDFLYNQDVEDLHLVFSELRYFISAEYSRRIINNFYLGMLYLGTQTLYKFDQGTDAENEFTEDFFKQNDIGDNFVSSIGLNLSYDSRDYPYYPTKGLVASIRPKMNATWLGSDNNYVDTDFMFKYYTNLNSQKIFALALNGGFAAGDVPFDGYQNYGVRNSLRGYTTGKYKGKNMVAAQVEYRWNFYKRWGAVAFAGSGSVWGTEEMEDGEKVFERHWLPSIGSGIRFTISKAKKVNLRLDFAWGVDGNQGLYFGVMEAF
ncbi:BamA/TamA family outer membrane protein [Carboxylicivirga sp. RSCT41]|uniref:BamA/TamA family outer membrane protein n=1 Tax=Carboxylicivirga agarovorans TaxID=3417570 RepID=UPI003D3542BC